MRLILADPERITEHPDEVRETGPLRRCIVTRETLPKQNMLRFVVGPEDRLIFDAASTLPGRGLWLSARQDVVEMALKRGAFAKAAKQRVAIPDALAEQLVVSLERRIVDLLGLARRSGAALAGFEKVREMLAAGGCAALIEARDGSLAERARLLNGRAVPVFTPLHASRLGGVFGRDAVMHIGLASGRLAAMIATEAARLAGLTNPPPAPAIAIPGKSGHRDEANACEERSAKNGSA
jgi:predicted RNA-binding protein YlxR (DUF448 family)